MDWIDVMVADEGVEYDVFVCDDDRHHMRRSRPRRRPRRNSSRPRPAMLPRTRYSGRDAWHPPRPERYYSPAELHLIRKFVALDGPWLWRVVLRPAPARIGFRAFLASRRTHGWHRDHRCKRYSSIRNCRRMRSTDGPRHARERWRPVRRRC